MAKAVDVKDLIVELNGLARTIRLGERMSIWRAQARQAEETFKERAAYLPRSMAVKLTDEAYGIYTRYFN